jgi:hypothetical protein
MTRPVALTALALALTAALTACGDNDKEPSATPSFESGTSPSAAAGPGPTAQATTGNTGNTGAPKANPTPTPVKTGPQIVYFRIKTPAQCPSVGGVGGGFTSEGNPIELEWKISGGPTQVTISVDGPGIYGTYAAEHAEKFNFSCPAPKTATNTIIKHTYLLKVPGYPALQQTITGEARAN